MDFHESEKIAPKKEIVLSERAKPHVVLFAGSFIASVSSCSSLRSYWQSNLLDRSVD